MSSSIAVSDPGIPMAERTYTLTPLKGVATPQYFIEFRDKGIWQKALVKSVAIRCFHCAMWRKVESTSGITDGWGLPYRPTSANAVTRR